MCGVSLSEYPKMGFSSLLLSNFHIFCSLVLSHPCYFSFILFFSPYIFKILSFLSPLFVTTTILLLALVTTLHGHNTCPDSESTETQPSFLFSFCTSVLEPKFDDNGEEDSTSLEAYNKMVVEACSSEGESKEITFVDKFCSHESIVAEALIDEELVEIQPLKFEDPMDLEKEETEKCEKEEEKVNPKREVQNWKQPTKQESKVQKVDVGLLKFSDYVGGEKKNEEEEKDVGLRSYGSMRKEKEWRRTLACKLFEERHNADVGQGMDQLWETYETQTEKKQNQEEKKKTKTKSMMKTKSIGKKEVVVEDEDGIDQQQLCCLQALKFSTGKMHLGIARPNLVKLSKAFKGFGRFYNATKHPKKASSINYS